MGQDSTKVCKIYTFCLERDRGLRTKVEKLDPSPSQRELSITDKSTDKQIEYAIRATIEDMDNDILGRKVWTCFGCQSLAKALVHSVMSIPPLKDSAEQSFILVHQAGPICATGIDCVSKALDETQVTVARSMRNEGISAGSEGRTYNWWPDFLACNFCQQ